MPKIIIILFLIIVSMGHLSVYSAQIMDNLDVFPVYGDGPVEIHIYTNYFCSSCRALELQIEPYLMDLVEQKLIQLKLIDIPIDQESRLCLHYFLYALKVENSLEKAFKVRSLLFDEAFSGKIVTEDSLIELFQKNDVTYEFFDVRILYPHFKELLKVDNIGFTPTVVIIKEGRKEFYFQPETIIDALWTLTY